MGAHEILEERLLANREINDDGCWLWTKSGLGHMDYGQTSYPGLDYHRNLLVHRVAAWLWLGFDLDSHMCVLHRCDVPRCFNPAHLFVGTRADNQRDMKEKGRARCVPHQGEQNSHHKLTDAIVREMRRRADACDHARGIYSILAREHGVTPQLARGVCLRHKWRHVPG